MTLQKQYEAAQRRNAKLPESFSLAPRRRSRQGAYCTGCRHSHLVTGECPRKCLCTRRLKAVPLVAE